MLALICLWPELGLYIDGEATFSSLVSVVTLGEVESPEEDEERIGEVFLCDLE